MDGYLLISIKRNPKISQPTSEEVTFLPIAKQELLTKTLHMVHFLQALQGLNTPRVLLIKLGKSTRGRTEKDLHSHIAFLRGENLIHH